MKSFTFKIDEKELEDLKEIAEKKDRSVGNLIRIAIRTFILDWRTDKLEEK